MELAAPASIYLIKPLGLGLALGLSTGVPGLLGGSVFR
jgi:hypothetical protein